MKKLAMICWLTLNSRVWSKWWCHNMSDVYGINFSFWSKWFIIKVLDLEKSGLDTVVCPCHFTSCTICMFIYCPLPPSRHSTFTRYIKSKLEHYLLLILASKNRLDRFRKNIFAYIHRQCSIKPSPLKSFFFVLVSKHST